MPVVIITTPQVFTHAVNKFTNVTGFNFEQFSGRIAHTAKLPKSLGEVDLLAIARHHGPELDERCLKEVVGQAMVKQSYIKAVENIISLARWNASRAGHSCITLADIQNASCGRIHGTPAVTAVAAPTNAETHHRPSTLAHRRQAAATLDTPAPRALTPATQPV